MPIRCLFKSLIFSMRSTSDVIKTFFQDQDLIFKTKTKIKTLKFFQDQA